MGDSTVSGPFFDGRADLAVEEFVRETTKLVANDGENMVMVNLMGSIRHPTGRYESRVHTDNAGSQARINDGGMIYGPWLEGTGSRNRTTRFKGYASFRRATAELARVAPEIAQAVLPRYVGKMQ